MNRKDLVIVATLMSCSMFAVFMLLAVDVDVDVSTSHEEHVVQHDVIPLKQIQVTPQTQVVDLGDLAIQEHKKSLEPAPKPVVVEKDLKEEKIEWYVVKSGDNPWKIAKSQKVDYDEIIQLNSLNEERAKNLKPGDRIRIR